jgi:hypothetical protein
MKKFVPLGFFLIVFFLTSQYSHAQYFVTTGHSKYVLLEEGTGTWCGYCPDGAEDIERNIIPLFPNAIVASFHNGDTLALTPDVFNSTYMYTSGWPTATIDRVPYEGNVDVIRPWDTCVNNRLHASANFQVDMYAVYDTTSRVIDIRVEGIALSSLSGLWNINAYVTEDSITSAIAPQHNYAGCSSGFYFYANYCAPPYDTSWYYWDGNPIAPASRYSHMHVVRAVLASGANIFGDSAFADPTIGSIASKSYTYTIPAAYNPKYIKVIGLIQKYDTALYNRPIENSTQSEVRLMPGGSLNVVAKEKAMRELNVYPNPATNFITVKAITNNASVTQIVIYNGAGIKVYDKAFKKGGKLFSENISLFGFAQGEYLLNAVANGETLSTKFVITGK